MMRTNNPLLNADRFAGIERTDRVLPGEARVMTLQGTVNASLVLLGLCGTAGVIGWSMGQSNPGLVWPLALGGMGLGLVIGLVLAFKPAASPFLAPIGAIGQGAMAGGLSVFWSMYVERAAAGKDGGGVVATLGTGLVLQAALLTLAIAGALLLAYTSRLIKPSENFKLGVAAATGGLAIFVLASLGLSFVGIRIPYLWENGIIGIGFSAAIVVLASLNLVLDFDFIEDGAEKRLPRYMEWFAAFGLLVTLVWLYISLLRLLAQLAARRE